MGGWHVYPDRTDKNKELRQATLEIPPGHREHGRDQKVGGRAKWCISSAECGMKDCAVILDEHQRDSHMPHSAKVVIG